MPMVYFRHSLLPLLEAECRKSGGKNLNDFCDKMIRTALEQAKTDSLPLCAAARSSPQYTPIPTSISEAAHVKLKKSAKEGKTHITDLCNSIAVQALTISEDTLADYDLKPLHRRLSFNLAHRDSDGHGFGIGA